VVCESDNVGKCGVFGFNPHTSGGAFGVSGTTASPDGAGVNGFSNAGNGVRGSSSTNDGVVGESAIDGKSGVFGFNPHTSGRAFGVSGTTASPNGAGVNGFSNNGTGIEGTSANGIGGNFSGGLAPLRLQPASNMGPPVGGNHRTGELFVDSGGALFFCIADGNPGTWRRVQLI
jgi:hypothetical protein